MNDKSITYETPEEMASFLDANPECAEPYLEETFGLVRTMVSWGDFITPNEVLSGALAALAFHAEHQGRKVLK